jgi:hypothetical protein
VFAKAWIDADNLESVFAAFEMSELFGRKPSALYNRADGIRLTDAMRVVIVETLERTVLFPLENAGHTVSVSAPQSYRTFADVLKQAEETAVFTFNYDVGLDVALHQAGFGIDYCLSPDAGSPTTPSRSATRRIDLLKLHGSINWSTCKECERVAAFMPAELLKQRMWADTIPNKSARLPISRNLATTRICPAGDHRCDGGAVIVPPTWSKAGYHQQIAHVWQRAAEHLAEARRIVVIGYSLPASDQFFRYLYALGTVGSPRLELFWLIHPEENGAGARVCARFKRLLGRAAERRFRYTALKFEESAGELLSVLVRGNRPHPLS